MKEKLNLKSKSPVEKRKSGFEDDPGAIEPCLHPEHNPPTHLCIPAGKVYRHVCPACGAVQVLRAPCIQ